VRSHKIILVQIESNVKRYFILLTDKWSTKSPYRTRPLL